MQAHGTEQLREPREVPPDLSPVAEPAETGKCLPASLEGLFTGVCEVELVGEPLEQVGPARERERLGESQRSGVLVGRLAMRTTHRRLCSGRRSELQHRRCVAGGLGVVRESREVGSTRRWRRKRGQGSSVQSQSSPR
jgi:hypothetical protein